MTIGGLTSGPVIVIVKSGGFLAFRLGFAGACALAAMAEDSAANAAAAKMATTVRAIVAMARGVTNNSSRWPAVCAVDCRPADEHLVRRATGDRNSTPIRPVMRGRSASRCVGRAPHTLQGT